VSAQLCTPLGKKERPPELNLATFVKIVAAHTGHSSQLFADATVRNAQFLATVVRAVSPKQLTKGLFLPLWLILFAGNILEGKGSLPLIHQSREGNHRLPRPRQGALNRASEVLDPHILQSEYKGQICLLILVAS